LRHAEKGDTDLPATFSERTTDQYNETDYFLSAELNQKPRTTSLHLARAGKKLLTENAGGRLILHIMAALAEFERSLNSERTRAGLA
jgi:DNA invertase Pin-like site-specific DNA recombinase